MIERVIEIQHYVYNFKRAKSKYAVKHVKKCLMKDRGLRIGLWLFENSGRKTINTGDVSEMSCKRWQCFYNFTDALPLSLVPLWKSSLLLRKPSSLASFSEAEKPFCLIAHCMNQRDRSKDRIWISKPSQKPSCKAGLTSGGANLFCSKKKKKKLTNL